MADAYISLDRVGLECPICLDKLDRPRSLPCLHTFCTKCLKEHIMVTYEARSGFTFPCPVCRTQTRPAKPFTDTQSWAEHFPINYWIQSILDEAGKSKHTDHVMCSTHKELRINLYCEDHNAVLCPTCVAMHHRACGNIVEIEKVLPGIELETQLDKIKSTLAEREDTVTEKAEKVRGTLDQLENERQEIKDIVLTKKEQLIAHIDELYGKFNDDLHKMFLEIESEIHGDETNYRNQKEDIGGLKDEIDTIDTTSYPTIAFIKLNQLETRLNDTCVVRDRPDPNMVRQTVVYARQDISETLKRSLSPGELRFSYRSEVHNPTTVHSPEIPIGTSEHAFELPQDGHEFRTLGSTSNQECEYAVDVMPIARYPQANITNGDQASPNTDLLSTKVVSLDDDRSMYNVRVFDTRIPRDGDRPSWISSMCRIKTNIHILCDQNSSSLKLLHERKLVFELHRLTKPWGVCQVSDEHIAVTFPEEFCIHIYEMSCNRTTLKLFGTPSVLGETFKLERVITTNRKSCYGLACMEDLLFVTCETSLNVYSTTGCLLNTVYGCDTNSAGFIRVVDVAVNPFRRTCYLSDEGDNKVYSFDVNDFSIRTTPKFVYSNELLKYPQGLDFDTNGRVYVCGFVSRNIHVVTIQGQVMKIISTVPQPWTISLDSSNSQLYISFFPDGPRDVNMYSCKNMPSTHMALTTQSGRGQLK